MGNTPFNVPAYYTPLVCKRSVRIFSERERPSVCRLSVVCLSVAFVRPTQAVQIFDNISMALGALGTLATH